MRAAERERGAAGAGEIRAVVLAADGPEIVPSAPWQLRYEHGLIARPLAIGVCQSDIKEVARLREGPSQFGHELVAQVEAAWGDAPAAVGDRVCLDPNAPIHRGTGFATLMPADGPAETLRTAFHRVPPGAPLHRLVFAEPLACAVRCVDKALRHRGAPRLAPCRIGVVGAGIAGTLIALCARELGASVRLFNRTEDRLAFLEGTGLLDGRELGPLDSIRDDLDMTILATDFVRDELLRWALRATRPGGLVILYGGTRAGDTLAEAGVEVNRLRRDEQAASITWGDKALTIAGTYGTDPASFARAIAWLACDPARFALERLIVREIGLDELPHLLKRSAFTRSVGKTVVIP